MTEPAHDELADADDEAGPEDTPPTDGVFRDWDGSQLDPQVMAEGERLGAGTPDVDYVEIDGQRREL